MSIEKLASMLLKTERMLGQKGVVIEPVSFTEDDKAFIKASSPDTIYHDAMKTINFHTQCLEAGIDDGRKYWKYCIDGKIVGLGGYHHRFWDPDHVVWGGWYIVSPDLPERLKMSLLFDIFRRSIVNTEYLDLYIEVFGDQNESNILKIYDSLMLKRLAQVDNFFGDKQDMVIMHLNVEELRPYLLQHLTEKHEKVA